jgi:hypothetical protein
MKNPLKKSTTSVPSILKGLIFWNGDNTSKALQQYGKIQGKDAPYHP